MEVLDLLIIDIKEESKMSKYKILALIGEAGSGKDTLMQRILAKAPDLHEIVSCTTCEASEGVVHGKNFFFLTEEEFNK